MHLRELWREWHNNKDWSGRRFVGVGPECYGLRFSRTKPRKSKGMLRDGRETEARDRLAAVMQKVEPMTQRGFRQLSVHVCASNRRHGDDGRGTALKGKRHRYCFFRCRKVRTTRRESAVQRALPDIALPIACDLGCCGVVGGQPPDRLGL